MKLDSNMMAVVNASNATAIDTDSKAAIQRKLSDMADVQGFSFPRGYSYPGNGGDGTPKSNEAMRCYTIAALIMSGFITWSGKTGLVYGRNGSRPIWQALTDGRARPWNPLVGKAEQGNREALIKKAADATHNKAANGYNALVAGVEAIMAGMRNGGIVTIYDTKGNAVPIRFMHPLGIKANKADVEHFETVSI